MSETENDRPNILAAQLEALSAENENDLKPAHTFDSEEAQAAADRIAAMTDALAKLSAAGGLQEPNLEFVDGPSSDVVESTDLSLEASLQAFEQSSMAFTEEAALAEAGVSAESPSEESAENEAIPDEPTEFIDNEKQISIVESLLFATDKPVSIATMKVIFKGSNVRTKDIQRAIGILASSYASNERGVALEEIHGGYQLRTKVDNTEYLKRLAKVRPFRLSGPALEVLAIVAYKQPVTKTEVDQIRGVESGHLVRALMERGMVTFGEKSDLPGRPMTYLTTRKFLETFGLRNIRELPTLAEIDQLLPEGIGDEEEKETLSMVTDQMSTQIGSTYSEGEDELMDISESLKVIDTTSEFFEQEKIRQRAERDSERAQDIRDKLAFGDNVEDKDRKWLARFEAKQEQMAQAAEAGGAAGPVIVDDEPGEVAAEVVAAGEGDAEGGLAGALAALSADAADQDDGLVGHDDDLSSNPDFDESDDAGDVEPKDRNH